MAAAIDSWAALGDADWAKQLAETRQSALEWRAGRPFEFQDRIPEMPPRDAHDLAWFAYAIDRFVFWSMIDVEDAAQSVYKSVVADYTGAHALFVNDDHNALGIESRTLARLFFPDVPPERVHLSGSQALVSIDRARALIGFEPEFSVTSVI
jgi:nucleoside-diphosphate-sugar epimerase